MSRPPYSQVIRNAVPSVNAALIPSHSRSDVYKRQEAGIPYQIFATTEQEFYTRSYTQIIQEVFAQMPDVDGIFASNDTMAAQILQYCHEHGINVPEQLQVVGFDDVELCQLTTPQLTTIHQPVKKTAEVAVNSIIGRRSKKVIATRTVLPVEDVYKRQERKGQRGQAFNSRPLLHAGRR